MARGINKPSKEQQAENEKQREEDFAVKYPHLKKTSKEWRTFYQEIFHEFKS